MEQRDTRLRRGDSTERRDWARAAVRAQQSRKRGDRPAGDYEGALEDYVASAAAFQGMRNLSGAIYARSNAALTLAELGRDDEAMREMEAVARRAAGSIDMRAALAAMHWSRGEPEEAETKWNWACEKINSGVLTEGGPALDGCALYRDMDWLARIRRWPPSDGEQDGRVCQPQTTARPNRP